MDVVMIGVLLVCFGSVALLVVWCDSLSNRKGR